VLITKTVYSWYFPETRQVVDTLWRERPHALYEQAYTKRQDGMHGPFLARWREWARAAGVELGDGFVHEYPTAGASEGIQALLARIAATPESGTRTRIHVFDGEYEGYQHLAAALSLETVVHVRDPACYETSLASCGKNDWFFVSQPSAIDGSVWSGFEGFVRFVTERTPGLSLAVDLTYVGSVARPFAIDLRSPSVAVVLASLSKPFGVYYHRIGLLLSRFPLASLYGNLWFKNLFSLALGERLLTAHGPRDLPERYQSLQTRALERARRASLVPPEAAPADVLLLACARLPDASALSPELAEFVRAREPSVKVLRFCLTPAMDGLLGEEA
jgi:histidinol-phosphate/aromatic aminotransferase/cobyric acid decarboxylase-like protein